jgi:hypothetical protein
LMLYLRSPLREVNYGSSLLGGLAVMREALLWNEVGHGYSSCQKVTRRMRMRMRMRMRLRNSVVEGRCGMGGQAQRISQLITWASTTT